MASTLFDAAFEQVQTLVAQFRANEGYYKSASYQEEEARRDFIDKFWTALGWDVNHDRQTNPYAQEVKVERGVTMSEGRKRADYAFYLEPDYKRVRFFVEAKKPSVEIGNRDSYFQAVRYGWNGETPLVVLTDFEQFHILDCRARPAIDTALGCAVRKFHYSDYADRDKFGQIYWLFGREGVVDGSLDKFVAAHLPKSTGRYVQRGLFHGGYQGIDESFLRDLDGYRGALARAFHKANPGLDSETLTECTQRVLDRLVFLRFLEDKLIESEPLVAGFGAKGGDAWADFKAVSRRLDTTYNGNIFKPHLIDRPTFHAPDAAFGQICFDLASDQSPYLFNIIPIHILGSIYERFLGRVIVVEGGEATVTDKPEVRKAGGVYYTPDYIVRYIVANTVGALIEGKTPAEIAPLRFADIACGSGSFLLGVYDLLLRHHTAYYNARAKGRAEEARKAGCEKRDDVWHLSLWQKREILLNNVYGVDIDAQAVEVAQLSLYLKLLEEETTATAHEQGLMHGAILPTLTKNIVFGNSLIGGDILQGQLFEPAAERKLNAMDFQNAFPKIMRGGGGFDAIVGNPPYIRIQTMQETLPAAVDYYKRNYAAAAKGNYDIYVVFVERALKLLNATGLLGYILPHKFFNAQYGEALRGLIAKGQHLSEIVHFGDQQVFLGATTYTCLLFLTKSASDQCRFVQASDLEAWREREAATEGLLPATGVTKADWNFSVADGSALCERLSKMPFQLKDVTTRIFQGIKTSADKIYIVWEVERNGGRIKVLSPQTKCEHWLEAGLLHPLIKGGDSRRYHLARTKRLILFPYAVHEGERADLIAEETMQAEYPLTWAYLQHHRKALEDREDGKMRHGKWYGYGRIQALDVMALPKIFTPDIAPRSAFSFDETGEAFFTGGVSGGYGVLAMADWSPLYLLALLNSRLLEWQLQRGGTSMRGGWYSYEARFIRDLPIRTIDFSDPIDKARHDKMVGHVEQMIAAKKELAGALTDRGMDYWGRKCEGLDRQIDALVYELYGLTDDEIALVEGKK